MHRSTLPLTVYLHREEQEHEKKDNPCENLGF